MSRFKNKTARPVKNTVACPVCNETRDARHTVLWDWYRTYYCSNFVSMDTHPLPKDFERIVESFVRLFRPETGDRRVHTCQWACHVCLHEGRAVAGNYEKQYFGMGGPILAYTDLPRTCHLCAEPFVFNAHEQQHWYKDLQFIVDSVPNECPRCRIQLRREKELHQRLGELLKPIQPTIEQLEELYAIYTELQLTEKAELIQRRLKNKKTPW